MDAVSDPLIHTVVCMTSAQIGKTSIIENVIGFHADQDPAPVMVVMPTLELAQYFSKNRLAKMVRDTPALASKFKDPRSRDSGNTLLEKQYPGGSINLAGSNAPAGLSAKSVRVLLIDEVDRAPESAGTEGDPVNLAIKRTSTFYNRKIILTSTPTIKNASRIEAAFEQSDQRRFFVPCPHCNEMQHLQWSQINWETIGEGDDKTHKPQTAVYVCEHCGAVIEENHKPAMLLRGEWRATSEDGDEGVAGFHLNELYSPWRRWSEVVTDFLKTKGRPEMRKTWQNTSLGETYEESGEAMSDAELMSRREIFDRDSLPEDVLVLTGGVDVQQDRLEITVIGWTPNESMHVVEHKALMGDTAKPHVWQDLDDYLLSDFDGRRIACCCVDSGFCTDMVHAFTDPRKGRRIYAIKGDAGAGKSPASTPLYTGKNRTLYYRVGTDTLKDALQARLRADDKSIRFSHTLDDEWFRQLTAEKVFLKHSFGRAIREWRQIRHRNEALDCTIYGWAAYFLLDVDWMRLQERLKPKLEIDERVTPIAPKRRARKSWAQSWR